MKSVHRSEDEEWEMPYLVCAMMDQGTYFSPPPISTKRELWLLQYQRGFPFHSPIWLGRGTCFCSYAVLKTSTDFLDQGFSWSNLNNFEHFQNQWGCINCIPSRAVLVNSSKFVGFFGEAGLCRCGYSFIIYVFSCIDFVFNNRLGFKPLGPSPHIHINSTPHFQIESSNKSLQSSHLPYPVLLLLD